MTKEPKRLGESPDELGRSISALRTQGPSENALAALAARLAAAGAPVDDAISAVVPKPAPRTKLPWFSGSGPFDGGTLAVVAALLTGAGIIAVAVLVREAAEPLTPAEPAPVALPESRLHQTPPPQRSERDGSELPSEATRNADVGSASGDRGAKSKGEPDTGAVLPQEPPGSTPSAAARALSEAAPAAGATPVPVERDPSQRANNGARRSAGATNDGTGAPLADNTVVETEIELLKQAKSALGADPLQAFALTERCRAQYANGSFAQEREYIAISALARLGRTSDARSRASLFRMHYPNSAYLPRLASMIGE